MKKEMVISFFMVLIAVIVWGFSYILSKQLLEVMGSMTVIFLRMIIASTVLFAFGLITKSINRIAKEDLKKFFLLALAQPFLYFIFELASLKQNSPTLTSLIISQIPLFVALIDMIFGKKRIPLNIGLGIIISLIGVAAVILGGDGAAVIGTPIGIVFATAAMACAIIYNYMVASLVKRYSPLTIAAYIHLIPLIYFTPFVLINEYDSLMSISFTTELLIPLLGLGIFCSAIAFLFYIYGVKTLGIITSSMINNLNPAVTALGMLFLFGEILSPVQAGGIIITISGLTLGLIKFKKRR